MVQFPLLLISSVSSSSSHEDGPGDSSLAFLSLSCLPLGGSHSLCTLLSSGLCHAGDSTTAGWSPASPSEPQIPIFFSHWTTSKSCRWSCRNLKFNISQTELVIEFVPDCVRHIGLQTFRSEQHKYCSSFHGTCIFVVEDSHLLKKNKAVWGDGRWWCSHFRQSQGSLFWRGSLEPRLERVMGSLQAEHSRQRIFYRFVPISHPLSGSSWKLSSRYVSLTSLCVPQIHKTYQFEVLTLELQRQLPGDRHQNCFREPDTERFNVSW